MTAARRPGLFPPSPRWVMMSVGGPSHGADTRATMTKTEALLQEILANPEDDAPRLAYAARLAKEGDATRAKFIRLQVEVAPHVPPGIGHFLMWYHPYAEPHYRALELLRVHGERWGKDLPRWVKWSVYERGFVANIACKASDWLRHGAELVRRVPLQRLYLIHTGRRLAEVAACPALEHLVELGLDGNRLDLDGLRALVESPHLPRLTKLKLSRNKLPPEAGDILAASRWPRLAELDLADNQLGDAGVEALVKARQLGQLVRLNLGSNRIRDGGAQALAAARSLPALQDLSLDRNRIRGGLAALLGSACLPALRRLVLSDNRAGGGALRSLARAGAVVRQGALILDGNLLDARAAEALAAWPGLAGVTQLDLNFNDLGDAGAAALAASPHLAGLTQLGQSGNGIGDAGARALAASPHLAGLTSLWLCRNKMTAAGLRALVESPHLGRVNELAVEMNEGPLDEALIRALMDRFGPRTRI
jgi:uncharacterized protein (TIGR02996 family)